MMTSRFVFHHRHTAHLGVSSLCVFTLLTTVSWSGFSPSVAKAQSLHETFRVNEGSALRAGAKSLADGQPQVTLTALKDYVGPARAYADHLKALAAWQLGDRDTAKKLWSTQRPQGCDRTGPSPLDALIRQTRARVLAPVDAETAAQELLALPPDPERWGLAQRYYTAIQQNERAVDVQRRLLIEFPASSPARELEASIGRAGLQDRLKTIEDQLKRLRHLVAANANDRAAAEGTRLSRAMASDDPRRCELLYIQGKTERKRRKYREASKFLKRARRACDKKENQLAIRTALLEAQVEAIRGRLGAVQEVVKWMNKKHPTHRFTDDAEFLLAEVMERKGRKSSARRQYAKVAKRKSADHAPIAEWRLAWADLRVDRKTRARPRLKRLIEHRHARREDRDRARYWLARTDERRRGDRAVKAYSELALHPSFYGWMALERLRTIRPKTARQIERTLTAAVKNAIPSTIPAALRAHPAFLDATAYAQAGEPELAAWSTLRVLCERADSDSVLSVALALHALGAYPEAQWQLRRQPDLLADAMTPKTVDRWRAAYSRPFMTELGAAAATEKLDPLLLTALAREESTFDPEVVSWAGATGLTQLMPATARSAYGQIQRGGRLDLDQLTDPILNARLGAHVLKQGVRAFGHPVLALGAYNGGPGLVRRYLKRSRKPFEKWIEDFGVKETRRYMKRVTESWGIYRLLYNTEEPFIRLPRSVARRRR